jgi:hypothetical protein
MKVLVLITCLFMVTGCAIVNTPPQDSPPTPSAEAEAAAKARQVARTWGVGCNRHLLDGGMFAQASAPELHLDALTKRWVDEVVPELARGYGGTMVVTARGTPGLDSPGFAAAYLRALTPPSVGDTKGYQDYRYCLERLLDRVSSTPAIFESPLLDWEAWRVWLQYENTWPNGNSFTVTEGGNTTGYSVTEPMTVMATMIGINAKAIQDSPARRRWWLDRIYEDMDAPGGRPMRKWLLMQFIGSRDTRTVEVAKQHPRPEQDPISPMRVPTTWDPFLVVERESAVASTPFFELLEQLAFPVGLAVEVRGVSAAGPRTASVIEVDLAYRMTQMATANVIEQESWSAKPHWYRQSFFTAVGSRSGLAQMRCPQSESEDGVFFFVFDGTLHVWPKAKLNSAVLQMAVDCGLEDDAAAMKRACPWYEELEVTHKSAPKESVK